MRRHLGSTWTGRTDHDRRRRPAQPGRPLQRAAAAHARRRGHPGRAADACCRSASTAGRARSSYDLDARAAQGRRGDDAAGAAGADERRVLPERPRVHAAATASTRDRMAPAARPRDRHAPRPDEPRHGDHRRGGRLAAAPSIVEQVTNGVAIRMAVLYLLLGGAETASSRARRAVSRVPHPRSASILGARRPADIADRATARSRRSAPASTAGATSRRRQRR